MARCRRSLVSSSAHPAFPARPALPASESRSDRHVKRGGMNADAEARAALRRLAVDVVHHRFIALDCRLSDTTNRAALRAIDGPLKQARQLDDRVEARVLLHHDEIEQAVVHF